MSYAGYNGYPDSPHWSADSRQLTEATNTIRSFVMNNIVQDNQWEIDRITKYYLFWKFYEGLHYKDFNDGLLSFNYLRAFIDKVNMFLLGSEAFSFHTQSLYSTQVPQDLERLVEELLMYHWTKSEKLQLAYEMLQMGSITGDCWVGVEWVDDDLDRFCRINVFDSRQCFVEFENGNYKKVKSFLTRMPLDRKGDNEYALFVTKWTKTHTETWYQTTTSTDEKGIVKHNHVKQENRYGFIPVVHIKNKPNSSGYYGQSDSNDILKINKVYNEMIQQIKAILDYHATPTTIITGASAKSLKRGLGQIWSGLPPEANVFNLGLDVDISASLNFAKDLKTAMHELSDVPENALGKIQAISNTSAAALQITYQPLIQQANIKAMTYGDGITKLNTMILKILSIEDPENTRLNKIFEIDPDFINDMKVCPVFAFGFPKDRMDELQRSQVELSMGIASKREVMERLGKSNIPELMKEIVDEKMQDALNGSFMQQLMMGGNPQNPEAMTPEEDGSELDEDELDDEATEDDNITDVEN